MTGRTLDDTAIFRRRLDFGNERDHTSHDDVDKHFATRQE
jgi:hypothetical protein